MSIRSEYDPLEAVVVHEPGYEWNLVTVEHNMPERYLIEDVLFTERAASDHREFTDCLKHVSGESSVAAFTDLLAEVLADRETRSDIVGAVSALEGVGIGTHDYLLSDRVSATELAQLLVAGAYRPSDADHAGYKVFFPPAPNLMFTRDLGMVLGSSVILSHPAKAIRRREALLARYIFRNHPLFKDIELVDILDDATVHGLPEGIHLEGGDVLILDQNTVIVGSSERTSETAIRLLIRRLLADRLVERIIKVQMPRERANMHLDTVFTIVGPDDCVYYPPFFSEENGNQPLPCTTYELVEGEPREVSKSAPSGLFHELERLGHPFPRRIPCGGDVLHYQTREQWTDGANLFAVRPRLAFIYERNLQTISMFHQAGYETMAAEDFLGTDPNSIGPSLVTLSGAELSRGRGGARCMTMPIRRQIRS